MPLVTIDLIDVIINMVVVALVAFGLGFFVLYALLPAPARILLIGKRIKRGLRSWLAVTNADNITTLKLAKDNPAGLKVGKDIYFLPSNPNDLINKRAILAGTGMPFYVASTKTGLATSPSFQTLIETLTQSKVTIHAGKELQELNKPEQCPAKNCQNKEFKTLKNKAKEITGFQCESCKLVIEPIDIINQQVTQELGNKSYSKLLIDKAEFYAAKEALTESPQWLKWAIIGAIPYILGIVLMIAFIGGSG